MSISVELNYKLL